ncbi:MAG TPA: hypothetical protein VMW27_08175 [Thermoanaerobaculia bacterium]|nr:hypothetical protein [Thermoanaerobaculia bacterium]
MTTQSLVAPRRDEEGRNVQRTTLAVTGSALLGGAAAAAADWRLGLFATAFLLGWTQLVGL